ncbi:MAG: T9SS type A sorting domain-containing protein [Chitinophagaceae bacterium]|nr:T9SS type A sorting domain-containing protein [Chitinophagaceae bacterium]
MKKILFLLICVGTHQAFSQSSNPEVTQGVMIKITPPLISFTPDPTWVDEIVRDNEGVIRENKDNIENRVKHPNALPAVKGKDAVVQDYFAENKTRVMSIIQNFAGHGNTGVSPADPSLCVGANHVVQMINGSSGARITIYNKSGGVVVPAQYMDAITGIPGLGDPVAVYDQFADRYVLTEFSSSGNKLVIMVSQTNDPTGSWYVYQFTAPSFPDYPKYGVWANSYICTSNEATNKVYAFDRPTMLAGGVTATMIGFSIPGSPAVGFQAAAPVNISGTNLPPVGTLPMVMRMTDDGWGGGVSDALEMWEMNLNFITPALSTLVQLPSINTAPFTTDLCGYVTLNCIRQPGSTRLDPIREIIMNRVWYRNFNTHQSIVLCHSVDATGLDQAGVRWYELRRNLLGPWSIYQQSTYAPDTNSRWMPTIGINQEGSIGLVYNVSRKNVFPSLRLAGRKDADPLNTMSEPEQVIIAGSTNNSNNRWGDYNDMQIDPANDATFWTTGMYMPNPAPWATRIAAFNILYSPLPVSLIAFDGQKLNETSNLLKWTAENEKNLAKYVIERAIEGNNDFATIATVNALSSQLQSTYEWKDEQFNALENYSYRLKMIDRDGKYRYSNLVNIQGKPAADIEIYPNPADHNTLYVRLSESLSKETMIFHFTDYTSKKVKSVRKNKNDNARIQTFDISELPAGLFIFSCTGTDGHTYLSKVIEKR